MIPKRKILLGNEIIVAIREIYDDQKIRGIISSKLSQFYSQKFIDLICRMVIVDENNRND